MWKKIIVVSAVAFLNIHQSFGVSKIEKADNDWGNLTHSYNSVGSAVAELKSKFRDRNDKQICLDVGQIYERDLNLQAQPKFKELDEKLRKKTEESFNLVLDFCEKPDVKRDETESNLEEYRQSLKEGVTTAFGIWNSVRQELLK